MCIKNSFQYEVHIFLYCGGPRDISAQGEISRTDLAIIATFRSLFMFTIQLKHRPLHQYHSNV